MAHNYFPILICAPLSLFCFYSFFVLFCIKKQGWFFIQILVGYFDEEKTREETG